MTSIIRKIISLEINYLADLVRICPFPIKYMNDNTRLIRAIDALQISLSFCVKKVIKLFSTIAKSCGIYAKQLATATQELRNRPRACFIQHVLPPLSRWPEIWSVPTLQFLYLWIQERCSHDGALLLPETRGSLPCSHSLVELLHYPGILTVLKVTLHTINLSVMQCRKSFVNILWSFRDMEACHSHKMIIWVYFWSNHHTCYSQAVSDALKYLFKRFTVSQWPSL